ncbi:MAG: inositol monophosphatase family protein [Candidatus Thorarchaeota archaeon]|nr:MAG: hypothetical protein DRP09_01735 [Candidatus Thorarchaeota archaeon]RLI59048.1 MAG: hypothetical protein DRO87_04125 [Candidatus Thorarchaeota archaeon]
MKLVNILLDAVDAAKTLVLDNMDKQTLKTGGQNAYGDHTLLLDAQAEDEIIRVLHESGVAFSILTEERGMVPCEGEPDYLVVVDPVDGSSNLERNIPLVTAGISAIPFKPTMTTDDIEVSVIESFFTKERYIAVQGQGVTRNGRPVSPALPVDIGDAIISYDTNRSWFDGFGDGSHRALEALHDIRRTASNLLDLCWTASGSLDGMADLRGILPIVHISGTHMVFEAGGFVIEESGDRLHLPIGPDVRMSFVAASNEALARQVLAAFKGHS